MLSASLFARSSPFRLSGALRTQVSLRSPSGLCRSQPALTSYTNFRWSSAAPVIEKRSLPPTPGTPSGTCFIANIPFKLTAEQLKEAFSEFAKVNNVSLLTTNTGVSRGVGFVQFESAEEAVNFIESHEADPIFVLDRKLYVQHAQKETKKVRSDVPSHTLTLFNIHDATEVEIRAMFGSDADKILQVRFHQRMADTSRRAYIQFSDVKVATEAMDAFIERNKNAATRLGIAYAKDRQRTPNTPTLASRLSQHLAD